MAIYFVVKTTDICVRVMYNIIIATSPIIIERNNIMIRKIMWILTVIVNERSFTSTRKSAMAAAPAQMPVTRAQ